MKEFMTIKGSAIIDTDCLSVLVETGHQSLLSQLFGNEVLIPEQVKEEIKVRRDLIPQVENMIKTGKMKLIEITSAQDMVLYDSMLNGIPKKKVPAIGKGEAAVLVVAQREKGIVVSNNKKDVEYYLKELGLEWLDSGMILQKAIDQGILSQRVANGFWDDFRKTGARMPNIPFPEYQKRHLGR